MDGFAEDTWARDIRITNPVSVPYLRCMIVHVGSPGGWFRCMTRMGPIGALRGGLEKVRVIFRPWIWCVSSNNKGQSPTVAHSGGSRKLPRPTNAQSEAAD